MAQELPDIDDFFDKDSNKQDKTSNKKTANTSINIHLSKNNENWIKVDFLNVAIAGIGIHILLPVFMEFSSADLKNIKIKFEKKVGDHFVVLKETPILVRWQEKDLSSGKLKLGIHFHKELKKDEAILEVINTLKFESSQQKL